MNKPVKDEYLRALGMAIADFIQTVGELEEAGVDLAEWNDEFMLSLYEATKDSRRV